MPPTPSASPTPGGPGGVPQGLDANDAEARKAVFDAYKKLDELITAQVDIAKKGKINIATPTTITRLLVCGLQSTGKSSLVESFLQFPCSFVAAGVGTRCPVKYRLQRELNSVALPVSVQQGDGAVKFMKQEDLAEAIRIHMQALANNNRFTTDFLNVTVKGPDYLDFEIVDIPGFQTLAVGADGQQGMKDIESVARTFLRNPTYQIVVMISAADTIERWTACAIIDRLTAPDPSHPDEPARPNWRQDALFVVNFLSGSLFTKHTRVQAMEALALRTSPEVEGRVVFAELRQPVSGVGAYQNDASTYFRMRADEIINAPAAEAVAIQQWCNQLEVEEDKLRMSPGYDAAGNQDVEGYLKGRIGIALTHKRIYQLWFDAFIKQLGSLRGEMEARVKVINESLIQMTNTPSEEALLRMSRNKYEEYRRYFSKYFLSIMTNDNQTMRMFGPKRFGLTWQEETTRFEKWRQTSDQPAILIRLSKRRGQSAGKMAPKPIPNWPAYLPPEQLIVALQSTPLFADVEKGLQYHFMGDGAMRRAVELFCFMCLVWVEGSLDAETLAQNLAPGKYATNIDLDKAIQKATWTALTNVLSPGVEWLGARLRFCAHLVVQLAQQATLDSEEADLAILAQQPAFVQNVADGLKAFIHELTDAATDFVVKCLEIRGELNIYDLVFKHVSIVQFTRRVSRLKPNEDTAIIIANDKTANPGGIDLLSLREGNDPLGIGTSRANLIYGKWFDQHTDIDRLSMEKARRQVEGLAAEQYHYMRAQLLGDVQSAFETQVIRKLEVDLLRQMELLLPISTWTDENIKLSFISTRSKYTEKQIQEFRDFLTKSQQAMDDLNSTIVTLKARVKQWKGLDNLDHESKAIEEDEEEEEELNREPVEMFIFPNGPFRTTPERMSDFGIPPQGIFVTHVTQQQQYGAPSLLRRISAAMKRSQPEVVEVIEQPPPPPQQPININLYQSMAGGGSGDNPMGGPRPTSPVPSAPPSNAGSGTTSPVMMGYGTQPAAGVAVRPRPPPPPTIRR